MNRTPDEIREDRTLSQRLTAALVIPILLLVAVGGILGLQLKRQSEDARWVDRSDQVLAKLADVQTQVIDQETGFRGFLLTRDRRFLQAYQYARPLEALAQLRQLVADNPEQIVRADEMRRRYQAWEDTVVPVLSSSTPDSALASASRLDSMLERKQHMDGIRGVIQNFLATEQGLRRERLRVSEESVTATRRAFVLLLAGAAAILAFFSRRQLRAIVATYGSALAAERSARRAVEDEHWVRAGKVKVATDLQGDFSVEQLADRVLSSLASYVEADVGAFFALEGATLRRLAGYALDEQTAGPERVQIGEGLVGQAAKERRIQRARGVSLTALKLRSATSEGEPAEVVVVPAVLEGALHAIAELGFLKRPAPRVMTLLDRIGENVALAVRSAEYKQRLRDLLEESQRQGEELQTQQEELRVVNEELQEQANALRAAHAHLEERQEELETSNQRLEEQASARSLAEQRLSQKAAELEQASRYKSEFLANMSHELRTPLNSALILAKLLADNKGGNLTEEQVRFAETIYTAGNDLLALINDILDLSKIEAGRMSATLAPVSLARLCDSLARTFEPLAHEKHIRFAITLDPGVAESIRSDAQRLEQILKNLLSNAIKFTDRGEVTLTIRTDGTNVDFSVRDTGIGIPDSKQALIFEAFRQVDAASNRKYGGTGLGLSISRDLAALLGGTISIESQPGEGSLFTLSIPISPKWPSSIPSSRPLLAPSVRPSRPRQSIAASSTAEDQTPAAEPGVEDDRYVIDRRRRLVLVVEDDLAFAQIVRDLAHEHDFQCLIAQSAQAGFALARRYTPSAIVLDMNLPDHSGLKLLDRLKSNPVTRHIPVHVVSIEDYSQAALSMGAVGYALKPVDRERLVDAFHKLEERLTRAVRRLLLVEDDERQRESLLSLLAGQDVEISAVGTSFEALEALRHNTFDCIVTDLTLPDASGFELLERIAEDEAFAFPPVIVYTGRSLDSEEEQRLRRYASSIVVKSVRSPERLLNEVTLFLHQVEADMPADRRRMLEKARDRETVFDGRKILIVEDDVRNIFALSGVLEPKGAKVTIARNGREALAVLEQTPDIDLVLMDIMMPEMDGLSATCEIRKQARWAKLPIIALTAKAMRDDQERCLEAGANDYISKPLDVETLLSLLRVWMPK